MTSRCLKLSGLEEIKGFVDDEFMAEEYLVEIRPNFNSGEPIRFLSHECGPFDRRNPISVPLWVALYLERHGKCTIACPDWLSVPNLRLKLRQERESGSASFSDVPEHMLQVALILLNRDYLSSDYMGGESQRNLMGTFLTELLMVRRCKMADGLKQIDVSSAVIDLSNMSSIERSLIRPQAECIMNTLRGYWTTRQDIITGETRGM